MKLNFTIEWMPVHILVGGILLTLYGLGGVFLGEYKIVYGLVFLLGLTMSTSRHMVTIDSQKKVYSDFYWIVGFKAQNDTSSYTQLLSLTITEGVYTQEYGMYVRRYISGTIYKIYLDIAEDEPLYVGQSKSLKKIKKRGQRIADQLGIELRDLSEK